MPELRTDPITGQQVIIAPERAERPFEHGASQPADTLDLCPFCAGNEAATPEPVLTLHGSDPEQWRVRIVPNRYPAVATADTSDVLGTSEPGIQPVVGRHEVVVESPEHDRFMRELPLPQLELVLRSWRDRLREIRGEAQAVHATLFKNEGANAGASLEHVHSQLLTTPFLPPVVEEELTVGARFYDAHGRNAWLEIVERELASGLRIVEQSAELVTFCPFASRFPAEMWVVPRGACPDFDVATDDELVGLAAMLKTALTQLDRAFPHAAYNLVVHTAPFCRDDRITTMQWHIQITPRLSGIAGFEIGAGTWVNIVTPEDAAARLRSS